MVSCLNFHNKIVYDFAKYMLWQPTYIAARNTLDRIPYVTGWSEKKSEICEANLFVRGDKNSLTRYA